MSQKMIAIRNAQKAFRMEADAICVLAESETGGDLTAVQEQRLATIKGELAKLDGELDAEIAVSSTGGNPTAAAPTDSRTAGEAEAAERKRSADIMAACTMAGKIDRAAGFISEGKSLSEVVGVLQSERAADSDKNATNAGNPTRHGKPEASWDKAVTRVNKRNGFN